MIDTMASTSTHPRHMLGHFKHTPTFARLSMLMHELAGGTIKQPCPRSGSGPSGPFSWQSKYPGTLDLRPDVLSYDPTFIDALMENDVPSMVPGMVLAHIQVRRSRAGSDYAPWHRDTYDASDGRRVGNDPPAWKLIWYPLLSHHPAEGIEALGIDDGAAPIVLRSSQDTFVLYDSFLPHRAEVAQHDAVRAIWTFLRPDQVPGMEPLDADGSNLHIRTMRAWEQKRITAAPP